MSSKQNITHHLNGIEACESKEYEHGLKLFMRITEPPAVIIFNMGSCYLKLNNFPEARKMFLQCVAKDKYLAIGHFQLGVAQTLCGDVTSATSSFQGAFKGLRGNAFIDYKQLNMSCKLYAAEINFNLGLAYLFSGDYDNAKHYIRVSGGSPTDNTRHAKIPEAIEAIENERWGYFGREVSHRLISLPENSLFGVSKAKQEGLHASTDFIPQAKVLAAANDDYSSFVGFVGARKLQSNNNTGQSTPTTKRSNVPMGPPPSIPPPRLPLGTAPPSKNVPLPPNERRPSPPNVPPPLTTPPPKVVPKYNPPSSKAPLSPSSPSKSPVNSGNIAMTELRKTMENVKMKTPNSSADAKAAVQKKRTDSPQRFNNHTTGRSLSPAHRPIPPATQSVVFKCEFDLHITNANISYDELVVKLSERMEQSASALYNSLHRKTATLDLEEPTKKTKVSISPDNNNTWQTTLSNVMKNRQSIPVLTLRENDRDSSRGNASPKRPPSPTPASLGYRPSRPAPAYTTRNNEDEVEEENIYQDAS